MTKKYDRRRVLSVAIDHHDVTGTVATMRGGMLLASVYIVRTTAWNANPSFTLGVSGTADKFVTDAEAKLDTALPGGEAAGVEEKVCNCYFATDTPVVATWNQNGATAGEGYVVLVYHDLD